jgi:hypothetical protein
MVRRTKQAEPDAPSSEPTPIAGAVDEVIANAQAAANDPNDVFGQQIVAQRGQDEARRSEEGFREHEKAARQAEEAARQETRPAAAAAREPKARKKARKVPGTVQTLRLNGSWHEWHFHLK